MDVWSRPAGGDRCDSIRERDLVDEENLTTTRAFRLRPHIAVVRLNRPDYRMMRDARPVAFLSLDSDLTWKSPDSYLQLQYCSPEQHSQPR